MTLAGLVVIVLVIGFYGIKITSAINNASNTQCNQVVDLIYEQCKEETNISISTLKGRSTTLSYDRGVCIIK